MTQRVRGLRCAAGSPLDPYLPRTAAHWCQPSRRPACVRGNVPRAGVPCRRGIKGSYSASAPVVGVSGSVESQQASGHLRPRPRSAWDECQVPIGHAADAAHATEAGSENALFRGHVGQVVADPEALRLGRLGSQDRLQQPRVEPTSTPGGERDEIPEIAIRRRQRQLQSQLPDLGAPCRGPPARDRLFVETRHVRAVAVAQPSVDLACSQPRHRHQFVRRGGAYHREAVQRR